jgi:hypothetical protein
VQEFHELRRPHQAADMGGQDAFSRHAHSSRRAAWFAAASYHRPSSEASGSAQVEAQETPATSAIPLGKSAGKLYIWLRACRPGVSARFCALQEKDGG